MIIKSAIFLDIAPCSLVDFDQTLRRNVLPSSSASKCEPREVSFTSCLTYSILKKEAVHSSGRLVSSYQIPLSHILKRNTPEVLFLSWQAQGVTQTSATWSAGSAQCRNASLATRRSGRRLSKQAAPRQ
jgi:hypothetical protein